MLELCPDSYAAYYNRGRAYNKLKRYEDSTKDFINAIKINPNDDIIQYFYLIFSFIGMLLGKLIKKFKKV